MKRPKLIYFLQMLPPAEVAEFITYVDSPIFNERAVLKSLLAILAEEYLDPNADFSLEGVYDKLYPDRPYNEPSIKTSMSQLLSLLKDYFAFSKFRKDPIRQQHYFLQKLNDLDESQYFTGYHSQAKKAADKARLNSSELEYERMLLEEELAIFQYRQPTRFRNSLGQLAIEHLGNSFLIRMIQHKIRLLNIQETFKPSLQYRLMDIAIQYIREAEDISMVVKAYFSLMCALEKPDEIDRYEQAVKLLSESVSKLSDVEADDLYTSAMNFAVRKVNDGSLDFLVKIFELYEDMLRHKFILTQGKISTWHFKNMVVAALRLGKFGWVEDFIAEWQKKVASDYNHNAIHYNQGVLNYYQKKYDVAEKHFNTVLKDYKDVFYGLNSRGYLLQIHFETRNQIGLESLIHSFRMFLSRNKEISTRKRQQYINFINHLTKLITIPPRRKDRLKKLQREIQEKDEKGMGSKWLLEKIVELTRSENAKTTSTG
jgi:tetratricopeptide (TPR) repeat protein